MKAILINREGTPVAENIIVGTWNDLSPKQNEVVVKTEASALNHLDLWVGIGMPGLDLIYPRISGSDGCGIISAVGENVDESWIGKRVLLNAAVRQPEPVLPNCSNTQQDIRMIGEHDNGTNAEYFVAPVENVLHVGDVDPVEAAAFGLAHLTAWRMLVTRSKLKAGQHVLITGIGGGAALAAFTICKHFGCKTIVTSRHQWKLDRALELGANEVVLDSGEDWSREVRRLTFKRGVDLCVDSVGGSLHHPCIKSLARGGTLVTCGCTAGAAPKTDLARIFWNQLSILGSTMGDMEEFKEVISLFKNGMKPVIDSIYDADDAKSAFALLESGEQFGKVVLKWE
ncbi:MAG: zinc-binding dehydrogenase [Phycisphaerales bacterium]|jgi:NADPH:quinone reductase-like Zn-dependent oxidoreductase|nr:zinc-binding dehydrogenase [Phycisphaerales bacterium]